MSILFTPIVIAFCLFGILFLLFEKWKSAVVLLTFAIVLNCYWQVFPVNMNLTVNNKDVPTFRLVTYNIYPYDLTADTLQWQLDVMDEIRKLNPDILCLQEFHNRQYTKIQEELHQYFNYSDSIIHERKSIQSKLYSRFPLTDIRRYSPIDELDTLSFGHDYSKPLKTYNIRQPFYSAMVHLPTGDSLVVFSCHLQSCGYSRIRRHMKEESWLSGIPSYVKAIDIADSIRLWESKNLRRYIDSLYHDQSVIIAGDFNDFTRSNSLKAIQQDDFKDTWWEKGSGFGFTYTANALRLRIDHILYRDNIRLRSIEVGNSSLSDHQPLIADLEY